MRAGSGAKRPHPHDRRWFCSSFASTAQRLKKGERIRARLCGAGGAVRDRIAFVMAMPRSLGSAAKPSAADIADSEGFCSAGRSIRNVITPNVHDTLYTGLSCTAVITWLYLRNSGMLAFMDHMLALATHTYVYPTATARSARPPPRPRCRSTRRS